MYLGTKIYNKKEFKKLENTEIIAETNLKKWDEKIHKKYNRVSIDNTDYVISPKVFGFSVEFIDVGNNEFIVIKKGIFLILFLITIIFITLIFGIFKLSSLDNTSNNLNNYNENIVIGGDNIEDYNEPNVEINNDSIDIPGLRGSYNLTEDNKEIYLINPENNTVYFKYTLLIDSKEIYSTDYIEPNKMIKANLYDLLDKGSYLVDILITTKDIDTLENCNGATLQTTINIKK